MGSSTFFDLQFWRSTLAGAENDRDLGVFCDSPISVVRIEEVREMAREVGDLGKGVPIDRIVFAKGAPPEPHATKVNGVPYRPAGVPWPRDSDGLPLIFLAQFSFADSRDHLDRLPGDVLVIFIRQSKRVTGEIGPCFSPNEGYPLVFEWHPLGLDHICTAHDCITSPFTFPTCYGVRHRSIDYAQPSNLAIFERVVPDELQPRHEARRLAALHGFNRHPGTKIGGLPFSYGEPEEPIQGRFLASFWGVSLATGAFPWTNYQSALTHVEGLADENFFMLGNHYRIDLHLNEDGTVECHSYRD